MADCTLDFLLERMMQLMNSDKELVLKVCEDKLIDKKQMEWVYAEMQFLRKFLTDSEDIRSDEVKQVVAKIRGVTCRVEDIIDSFLLFNAVLKTDGSVAGVEFTLLCNRLDDITKVKRYYFHSVKMAKKIIDCSKSLMEDIDCIKRYKTEVMEILSWLQTSHMPADEAEYEEDDDDVIQVDEEIKFLIKQVMEVYDEAGSSSLRWLESSDELVLLCNLCEKVLHWNEKDSDPFVWTQRWSGKLRLPIPWFVPLLFYRFNDMVNRSKQIHHQLGCVIQELKLIKIQVKEICGKGFNQSHSANRFYPLFDSTYRFYPFFDSTNRIIRLAEAIHSKFGSVIEERKALNTKAMKAVKCRIIELISPTLAYVEMHQGLGDVKEDIKSIKEEVMEIYQKKRKKMYGIGDHRVASKPTNPQVLGEIVVGLDDDKNRIMELLVGEHEKDLTYISIIGMGGLGKTTLARNVYNDPFIVYHFYIRAWTSVSQVYNKRDILLSILSSARIQVLGNIGNMSYGELGVHFFRDLKGKRYLVVMDDLWEIGAWDDLKRYFPNDRNGSRFLVTSRLVNVALALQAKSHSLHFLNENESWNLLCLKVFREKSCPMDLIEIGKGLARKCGGLPLAIVVVSGFLAKEDKTKGWWRQVSESLSSYINSDQELVVKTLALSYNHLPQHLKPCFLYFGAFPEDYEIHVRQLIWLWVAEGFVRQNDQKSLEEVAEDYLMDLIDRGLVIVSMKRSDGRIKVCRVHDLLRDLCLRKAEEENFLQHISRYEQSSYSFTNPFAHK